MSNNTIVRNGLVVQGNIDLLSNQIISSTPNSDITLTTDGTGKVILNTTGTSTPIIEANPGDGLHIIASGNDVVISTEQVLVDAGYIPNTALSLVNKGYVDSAIPSLLSQLSGTLSVANGGTGIVSAPANSVIIGAGTSAFTSTPIAQTGYLYFDGSAFLWQTPTGGGTGGAPTNASYVTIGSSTELTDERTLAVSSDLSLSDGGAGNSVTLGLTDTTVTPGEYTKVTVDQKGRVTTGTALSSLDLPTHSHDATDIVTGVIAPARMGTGTASSSTYLRGDGTWAAVSGGGSSITEYVIKVNFDSAGVITTIEDVSNTGWTITNGTSPSAYVQINHNMTKIPVSVVCFGYSPTTTNFMQKMPTTSASTGFACFGSSDMNTLTIYGFTTSNSGAGNSGYTLIKILMA